jgi:lysophospholipase L1-like esterase
MSYIWQKYGRVAELVYAFDLKSNSFTGLRVRVPPRPPPYVFTAKAPTRFMNKLLQNIIATLKSGGSYRVVFLGDSLTSTEWVHPNWREIVEYVLKEELVEPMGDWRLPSWGLRFYNAGFDGSTTRDWLAKLDAEVLALRPNLLFVMGTSNDELLGVSPQESADNIDHVITAAAAKGCQVVFATDTTNGSVADRRRYEPYVTKVRALFPRADAMLVDLSELFGRYDLDAFYTFRWVADNADNNVKAGDRDTSHPNRLGQAYTAKIYLEQVFGVSFNPEKYLSDLYADHKKPRY